MPTPPPEKLALNFLKLFWCHQMTTVSRITIALLTPLPCILPQAFGRATANLKFESFDGGRDSRERMTQVMSLGSVKWVHIYSFCVEGVAWLPSLMIADCTALSRACWSPSRLQLPEHLLSSSLIMALRISGKNTETILPSLALQCDAMQCNAINCTKHHNQSKVGERNCEAERREGNRGEIYQCLLFVQTGINI